MVGRGGTRAYDLPDSYLFSFNLVISNVGSDCFDSVFPDWTSSDRVRFTAFNTEKSRTFMSFFFIFMIMATY